MHRIMKKGLDGTMADLFLQIIDDLIGFLEKKSIPHIIDYEYNLLSKLSPETVENMLGFLKRASRKMKDTANTPNCRAEWMALF